MANRGKLHINLLGAVLPLVAYLGGHAAFASDPLPGDLVAPPANVNIALFYNLFSDAGEFGALRGNNYTKNTHLSTDIIVARYIRTFNVAGFLSGVQFYEPYVAFIGKQEAGVANIPGPYVPALGGQLPSYGPGSANLSDTSGFAQPSLGIFTFPINNPITGTYATIAPWIDPPVSSFNKNSSLNPSQNVWTYELELGVRTVLFGTPTTRNLAIEVWSETYVFGANGNSAYVSPEASANNIPAIYGVYHTLSGGQIPDTNPLQAASVTPASFHEQPSQEIRVYLPYEFAPSMGAYIAPGFYQSFGGKQTYTLQNGVKVDSGNRTDETQLRLIAATFLSPTFQVMAVGDYDIAAHGEPLARTFEMRFVKFF